MQPSQSPFLPPQQHRNWAMLAHLAGLSFLTVPFGNIVGPLLIWQIKREEMGEFVGASAREALNFQFTFTVLVGFVLSLFILPLEGASRVAILLLIGLAVGNVYFCIMATLGTNRGEVFRYPYAFRPF